MKQGGSEAAKQPPERTDGSKVTLSRRAAGATLVLFACLALSKLPWVLSASPSSPLQVSSSLVTLGWETGLPVQSDPRSFVLPHILLAVFLELLLASVYLGLQRVGEVRLPLLVLTALHVALVYGQRFHLGRIEPQLAEKLNMGPCTVALASAVGLMIWGSGWQLHFLALALNAGPLGELAFWPATLHRIAAG
eukprot:gb/GEZN01015713.1/.p1 GENE.gb/GEZN01015713.1/~~gb/GEZN01015713.1/.p1  ORF type:complete len:193 (+),score=23.14 gb/GEZN01015713.1/:104-682(+)